MDKDQIRMAIATDLRGKPSRNPDSLMPDVAKQLNISAEAVVTQMRQMTDLGHIVSVGQASIRLSEDGELFYFSSKKDKTLGYLKANALAILALAISLVALFRP